MLLEILEQQNQVVPSERASKQTMQALASEHEQYTLIYCQILLVAVVL